MNVLDRSPAFVRNLWNRPFFLMIFTTLFWGGNVVAGRMAVGEVSPMAVVFLRWLIAFALLATVAARPIREEYRLMLPHWRLVLVMGIFGYTGTMRSITRLRTTRPRPTWRSSRARRRSSSC